MVRRDAAGDLAVLLRASILALVLPGTAWRLAGTVFAAGRVADRSGAITITITASRGLRHADDPKKGRLGFDVTADRWPVAGSDMLKVDAGEQVDEGELRRRADSRARHRAGRRRLREPSEFKPDAGSLSE